MQIISSKDNRIIKEAASLSEKKFRDNLGLYLLEGPNIVKEAMEEGGRVRFIFTKAGECSDEIQQILKQAEAQNLAAYELTSDIFAKVTHTNSPQAVAAVFEKRQMSRSEFFEAVGDENIIVLDRLQDPGNVGTILRTAEAFGFKGIIIMKGTADIYQPKIVRAAAGSIIRLSVLYCSSADEVLSLLSSAGIKLIAADLKADKAVYEYDLRCKTAIVIGNEGNGISADFRKKAAAAFIPMYGKTESLNAAVAAAAIMYESLRQRRY